MSTVHKKIFIAAVCLVWAFGASAQNSIIVKGDTIILSNGAKYWLGEEITLGAGSSPDKAFSYIYDPIIHRIAKKKGLLSADYAGRKATIKKFQRDGAYKGGYSYNILVLDLGGPMRFWCDVQGALDNNEILSPVKNKPDTSKEAKLLHLKKLLDAGEISQEEYETLKSKIVENKGTNNNDVPNKKTNKPVVY
jgi:hypothetical protein